jgi:hypothetical protein
MDSNQEKYRNFSLAGKWIKLASQVIEDNPGITEYEYMRIVCPFMPTHIVRNQRRATKVELAREALRMIKLEVKDGKMFISRVRSGKPGFAAEIIRVAKDNEEVTKKSLPHIENFSRIADYLVARSLLRKISPGVYKSMS